MTQEFDVYIIVDDNIAELENMAFILNDEGKSFNLSFRTYNPKTDDDLRTIAHLITPEVRGIIFDQRLSEASGITLDGIKVAKNLRSLNDKIPIFILTKFIDDEVIIKEGFSIEDAIDKKSFVIKPIAYMGRLARAAGRYREARDLQSNRLNELAQISFTRKLTESEIEDLNSIRSNILLPNLIDNISHTVRISEDPAITEALNILKEIRRKIDAKDN